MPFDHRRLCVNTKNIKNLLDQSYSTKMFSDLTYIKQIFVPWRNEERAFFFFPLCRNMLDNLGGK